jgi:ABC-2 type transport system permease protein
MKQFIIFVQKEFFHIFRDRKSLLIIILMPIVQIILFGFALTNEIKDSNIAVMDNSKDIATAEITQRLESSRYFSVAKNISTPAEMEAAFKTGKSGWPLFSNPVSANPFCTAIVHRCN